MELWAFAERFRGRSAIEGSVRSIEVVEVLPLGEHGLEIDVALVGQELVKLLLV